MTRRALTICVWLAGAVVAWPLAPIPGEARPAEQPVPRGQAPPERPTDLLRRKIDGDNRSNPVASVAWAEEAVRVLDAEARPKEEIWFLLALVRDLRVLGDYPKAQAFVERARPLVARNGTAVDHFQLEVGAAAILLDRERFRECKTLLDSVLPEMEGRATAQPRDVETRRLLASACRVYGAAQSSLGALADAVRVFRRAQVLYAETRDQRGQAWVLDQMSGLYAQLKRFKDAEQSAMQAVALAQDMGDGSLEAAFRLDLSNVYGAMDDGARQLEELRKATPLAEKAGDANLILTVTVNLADAYLKRREYQSSLGYSDTALRLATQAQDASAAATCQVNRGIALNRMGRSKEGLEAIRAGLEHFRTVRSTPVIAEISGVLAEEYAFAGEYRKAYDAHVAFKAASDELMREDDRRHVAEASAGFESDKKQLQIEALERDRRNQRWRRALSIAIGCLGLLTAGLTIIGQRRVHVLKGLIPICSCCKKIRSDEGYWSQVEQHIKRHPKAQFRHGICPDCMKKVTEQLEREGHI